MFILVFLITFTSNPVEIRIKMISNSTKVYCFFFCHNILGLRFKFVKFRICASFLFVKGYLEVMLQLYFHFIPFHHRLGF